MPPVLRPEPRVLGLPASMSPHLGHLVKPGLHVCQLLLGLLQLCFQFLVFGQCTLVELGDGKKTRLPPRGSWYTEFSQCDP